MSDVPHNPQADSEPIMQFFDDPDGTSMHAPYQWCGEYRAGTPR